MTMQQDFHLNYLPAVAFCTFQIRVRRTTSWQHDFKRENHCVQTQGDSRLKSLWPVVRSTFQPECGESQIDNEH